MKTKILLVDDNPDCRKVFGLYLRYMGYELSEAKTGHEGIEHAKNACPDLMILDLGLPDMSGLQVLALLKQDSTTAGIPVVVQTAWAMDNIRTKALQAGAAAFLVKPTSPIVLNETIKMILDQTLSTPMRDYRRERNLHSWPRDNPGA
jgi:two-component system KDP operon response regulator KdpE